MSSPTGRNLSKQGGVDRSVDNQDSALAVICDDRNYLNNRRLPLIRGVCRRLSGSKAVDDTSKTELQYFLHPERMTLQYLHVEPHQRTCDNSSESLRTTVALEKSMHFLVEQFLRDPLRQRQPPPHSTAPLHGEARQSLLWRDQHACWTFLWDRFRRIRTSWSPQLPPYDEHLRLNSPTSRYINDETGDFLNEGDLHLERTRRARWLEFTVAAFYVGAAGLCRTPEGCKKFLPHKKNFLESISQCFSDLCIWYRAQRGRYRHAEFFSVLLLSNGLRQERKVEGSSFFCSFRNLTLSDNGEAFVPEDPNEALEFKVYRELQYQPHLARTKPVRTALRLLHCWASREYFDFFAICRGDFDVNGGRAMRRPFSSSLTPLQRAVVFQSFTYARYRAVLDLLLPNYTLYVKLRIRDFIPISTLAYLLLMDYDHCIEFLRVLGVEELISTRKKCDVAPCLIHSDIHEDDSDSVEVLLLTDSESRPRANLKALRLEGGKEGLFLPTFPEFFGFRPWADANQTHSDDPHDSPYEQLRKLHCPIDWMAILEPYCPPYTALLANYDLEDADEVWFSRIFSHRQDSLSRYIRYKNEESCNQEEQDLQLSLEEYDKESVETHSSIFDSSDVDEEETEGDTGDMGVVRPAVEGGDEAEDSVIGPDASYCCEVVEALIRRMKSSPIYYSKEVVAGTIDSPSTRLSTTFFQDAVVSHEEDSSVDLNGSEEGMQRPVSGARAAVSPVEGQDSVSRKDDIHISVSSAIPTAPSAPFAAPVAEPSTTSVPAPTTVQEPESFPQPSAQLFLPQPPVVEPKTPEVYSPLPQSRLPAEDITDMITIRSVGDGEANASEPEAKTKEAATAAVSSSPFLRFEAHSNILKPFPAIPLVEELLLPRADPTQNTGRKSTSRETCTADTPRQSRTRTHREPVSYVLPAHSSFSFSPSLYLPGELRYLRSNNVSRSPCRARGDSGGGEETKRSGKGETTAEAERMMRRRMRMQWCEEEMASQYSEQDIPRTHLVAVREKGQGDCPDVTAVRAEACSRALWAHMHSCVASLAWKIIHSKSNALEGDVGMECERQEAAGRTQGAVLRSPLFEWRANARRESRTRIYRRSSAYPLKGVMLSSLQREIPPPPQAAYPNEDQAVASSGAMEDEVAHCMKMFPNNEEAAVGGTQAIKKPACALTYNDVQVSSILLLWMDPETRQDEMPPNRKRRRATTALLHPRDALFSLFPDLKGANSRGGVKIYDSTQSEERSDDFFNNMNGRDSDEWTYPNADEPDRSDTPCILTSRILCAAGVTPSLTRLLGHTMLGGETGMAMPLSCVCYISMCDKEDAGTASEDWDNLKYLLRCAARRAVRSWNQKSLPSSRSEEEDEDCLAALLGGVLLLLGVDVDVSSLRSDGVDQLQTQIRHIWEVYCLHEVQRVQKCAHAIASGTGTPTSRDSTRFNDIVGKRRRRRAVVFENFTFEGTGSRLAHHKKEPLMRYSRVTEGAKVDAGNLYKWGAEVAAMYAPVIVCQQVHASTDHSKSSVSIKQGLSSLFTAYALQEGNN